MTVAEMRRASTLLRVLANAEIARLEDDPDRVVQLLDVVDPVEVHALANTLAFDAAARDVARRIQPMPAVAIRKPW